MSTARVYLVVPAGSPRMLDKVRALAVDALVIDLDGADESEKDDARAAAVGALLGGDFAAQQLNDKRGLRAASARAAGLGFDGKWAIHPAQLESIVTAFSRSRARD